MGEMATLSLRVRRRWWVDPGLALVGRVMPRIRRWPWLSERAAAAVVWLFVRFGFKVTMPSKSPRQTTGDEHG